MCLAARGQHSGRTLILLAYHAAMATDPRVAAAPVAEPGDGGDGAPASSIVPAVADPHRGIPPGAVVPSNVPGTTPRPPGAAGPDGAGWLEQICPYLRAADATWRSAIPTREHRCWAVTPASTLPSATQQELCLTPAHRGCERFLHSQGARADALARDEIMVERLAHARFGALVSAVPVAVDPRPAAADQGQGANRARRRRIPAMVIGGGVILVGAAVLAAFLGGGRIPGFAVASATPPPVVSAPPIRPTTDPSVVAVATPASTPMPTHSATIGPTQAATALPTPDGTQTPVATDRPVATSTPRISLPPGVRIARRYTVKDGDTVKSIANKFGLKPRELRAVNRIGADVVPGQQLLIPVAGTVPAESAAP